MILSEVITLAKERLKSIYPEEEINAITMLLCQHFFGISKVSYYTSKQTALSDSSIPLLTDALDKLRQYCPIQYVLRETSFYGYTFKLNENVLIPRPETEELVDWVCLDYKNSSQINILDIGTGSGAIAISLAKNLPSACITAIDISAAALNVAQANASLNNATISFLEEDIFHPSSTLKGKRFDIIVSNPPYVQESEKKLMSYHILNYEPSSALFVPNDDPLKYYKAIAAFAQHNLSDNGSIYLEINEALGSQTVALFSERIYLTALRKDINEKDRMLKAVRK